MVVKPTRRQGPVRSAGALSVVAVLVPPIGTPTRALRFTPEAERANAEITTYIRASQDTRQEMAKKIHQANLTFSN